MGAVARGARDHGAQTIALFLYRAVSSQIQDPDATQLHLVQTMRERKAMIEELSDGFIALPGGIGTLEEFFEIWLSIPLLPRKTDRRPDPHQCLRSAESGALRLAGTKSPREWPDRINLMDYSGRGGARGAHSR
jgi:hypothetical protein